MGVNMSITRMKTCDFENPSELPITRAEVDELVNSDPSLLWSGDEMIYWFPNGKTDLKTESENVIFFDEKVGILYSDHTKWEEIPKLVEVAEKLHANLLDEDSAIYLPNGEVLDEAWKGETLWQSFRRWLKGQPRSTEFKPVHQWDKRNEHSHGQYQSGKEKNEILSRTPPCHCRQWQDT